MKNIYTSFDYNSNDMTIDFRNGNWLIANQEIINTDFDDIFDNHPIHQFLNNRIKEINKLKNDKNQYVYSFPIKKELNKKELKNVRELSNFDYIIIPSIENIFSQNSSKQKNKISIHEIQTNAIKIEVRIYNLQESKLIYHLTCYATEVESDDKNNDFLSGFNTKYLSKKIFKEIKKHAIY